MILSGSQKHKIVQIFAVIAILFSMTRPACASSRAEYEQTLAATARQLQTALHMEQRSLGSGKQILQRLAQDGASRSQDVDEDGDHITCDLNWVAADIHRIERMSGRKRIDAISRLFDKVDSLSFAAASKTNREISSSKARSTLNHVLAGYEYKPTFWDNLYKKLLPTLRSISEAIARVFGKLPPGILHFGNKFLIVLAAVAFAITLVFLIMRIIGSTPDKKVKRIPQNTHTQTITRPDIAVLLAQAETDAAGGRYREALRAVYLATLLQLDRHGAISYTESGTNWEYMKSLSQSSGRDKTTIFRTLTTLFDESIYGHRDLSASDYAAGMHAYRQLGDAS